MSAEDFVCSLSGFNSLFSLLFAGHGGNEIWQPQCDGGALHAQAEDGILGKLCRKIASAAVILWVSPCSGIEIADLAMIQQGL